MSITGYSSMKKARVPQNTYHVHTEHCQWSMLYSTLADTSNVQSQILSQTMNPTTLRGGTQATLNIQLRAKKHD